MTPLRCALLGTLARRLLEAPSRSMLRVAIDGLDGAGKTHFADELAAALGALGRPVIRASVDGFHHPREVRYRRGRTSPEGFYRDSYDYAALKEALLEPLTPGGSGLYRTAVYDVRVEQPVVRAQKRAEVGAILLFDGIFLHRPELRGTWDVSVWLEVPFSVSIPRGAARGEGFGSPDPAAESNRRYVEGQRLYLRESQPQALATIVIDNSVLDAPYFIRGV